MKLHPLYYTSCRRGLRPSAGFQTLAMSPEIAAEERAELERLLVYTAPLGLPPQPTPEEIAELFPVSFGFCPLSSGRWAVFQSTYAGRDYSGRFGNYFGHALVGGPGPLPWPAILLWKSPLWRAAAADVESRVADSGDTALADLEAEVLTSQWGLQPDEVAAFLAAPGAAEKAAWLTDALLATRATRQPIVVDGSPEEAARWFAAALSHLPVAWTYDISFSTWTHDPEAQGFALAAARSGWGRFRFADGRDSTAFVFSPTAENAALPSRSRGAAPPLVAGGNGVNALRHAEHFEAPHSTAEFDASLDLLRWLDENESLPSGAVLGEALAFATERAKPAGRQVMAEALSARCEAFADECSPADLLLFARYLAESARTDEAAWNAARQLAQLALPRLIFEDSATAADLLEATLERSGQRARMAAELLGGEAFLACLHADVAETECPAPTASSILHLVLKLLSEAGPADAETEALAEAATPAVRSALSRLASPPETAGSALKQAPDAWRTWAATQWLEAEGEAGAAAAGLAASFGDGALDWLISEIARSPAVAQASWAGDVLCELAAAAFRNEPREARNLWKVLVQELETARFPALAALKPRLFAICTQSLEKRAEIAEACLDFLEQTPPDASLEPVFRLLESCVAPGTPPSRLRGRRLALVQEKKCVAEITTTPDALGLTRVAAAFAKGRLPKRSDAERTELQAAFSALTPWQWDSLPRVAAAAARRYYAPVPRRRGLLGAVLERRPEWRMSDLARLAEILGGDDPHRLAAAAAAIVEAIAPTFPRTRSALRRFAGLLHDILHPAVPFARTVREPFEAAASEVVERLGRTSRRALKDLLIANLGACEPRVRNEVDAFFSRLPRPLGLPARWGRALLGHAQRVLAPRR